MSILWTAVAALLVALLPLPYDGYMLVKWVVTVSCARAAYKLSRGGELGFHGWACIAIGGLYNPFAPFYLSRGLWILLDLVAAGLLVAAIRSAPSIKSPDGPAASDGQAPSTPASMGPPQGNPPATPQVLARLTRHGGDDFARIILRTSVIGLALLAILIFLFERPR